MQQKSKLMRPKPLERKYRTWQTATTVNGNKNTPHSQMNSFHPLYKHKHINRHLSRTTECSDEDFVMKDGIYLMCAWVQTKLYLNVKKQSYCSEKYHRIAALLMLVQTGTPSVRHHGKQLLSHYNRKALSHIFPASFIGGLPCSDGIIGFPNWARDTDRFVFLLFGCPIGKKLISLWYKNHC